MIRANDETLQAVHSLQSAHGFRVLTQFLEEEYSNTIAGLLAASTEKMQPLQGRALLLKELINLYKYN